VAPSEIGVHSATASEIASGQPADGSALAPASEGKHTGSTLTIGGAAGGAAPSVFDAATLKRLAAAAAAHTKTQLAETNVPRQRLRKHGVPILGADGLPLRRYPRKFPVALMEPDVRAALAGEPLPPPSLAFLQAWEDAKREATKSEYAFKPGLNYYAFGSPAS
jgi:hypothetical protein